MPLHDEDSGKIHPDVIKERIKEKLNQPVKVWHVLVGALFCIGADAYIRNKNHNKLVKALNLKEKESAFNSKIFLDAVPGDRIQMPSGKIVRVTAEM